MCGPASRASLPFFFLPRRKEGRVAGCLGREGGRRKREIAGGGGGVGGGERCPLLPPPPPLFEFKCFCVRVSFISPDEHISSKWMLMFQPIDGYCFFYFFIFLSTSYAVFVCGCVRPSFYFMAWRSIHPSRLQFFSPPPEYGSSLFT